jgi:hypothetical protein
MDRSCKLFMPRDFGRLPAGRAVSLRRQNPRKRAADGFRDRRRYDRFRGNGYPAALISPLPGPAIGTTPAGRFLRQLGRR